MFTSDTPRTTKREAVFDKGSGGRSSHGASMAGFASVTTIGLGLFRTTEADKRPARSVVAMGEPSPERQSIMRDLTVRQEGRTTRWSDDTVVRDDTGRRCTQSGRILLTRREYAETHGVAL